jgi:large subunit ribosomal protein L13
MKTFSLKKSECQNDWILIDATDETLGRLASRIAMLLRGKCKTTYTPHMTGGSIVVVINATKIKLTGNKFHEKIYYHHSGYLGGLKTRTYAEKLSIDFKFPLMKAVQRMLNKGPLARELMRRLHIFADNNHPHQAQLTK